MASQRSDCIDSYLDSYASEQLYRLHQVLSAVQTVSRLNKCSDSVTSEQLIKLYVVYNCSEA